MSCGRRSLKVPRNSTISARLPATPACCAEWGCRSEPQKRSSKGLPDGPAVSKISHQWIHPLAAAAAEPLLTSIDSLRFSRLSSLDSAAEMDYSKHLSVRGKFSLHIQLWVTTG
jgi:hypothetical protein